MPKKEEPEYQILRNKGIPLGNGNEIFVVTRGNDLYILIQKETPNHKILTRVTNEPIPIPKGEKSLIIRHNQIISTSTPVMGIPK
jgi:hypothetical protein